MIIVGTFYDQLTSQEKKNGFVERMHNLICQLYVGKDLNGGIGIPRERGLPRVVRVIDVSCTSGHHINLLREMIYTTALEIKGPGESCLCCWFVDSWRCLILISPQSTEKRP